MFIVNLVGERVKHIKYGEGVIKSQDKSYVSVQFMDGEEKKFQYPVCFKSFLKILNTNAAIQTEEVLKQYEQEQTERKEQKAEQIRKDYYDRAARTTKTKNYKKVELDSFHSVEDFCKTYNRSIDAEIIYLKATGGKHQQVFDGQCIEHKKEKYIYTFEADDELNYPDGTQINIWKPESGIYGQVLGCEDFTIIIQTSTNLGMEVEELEFSAEPWKLLDTLRERIHRMQINQTKITRALICDGEKSIDYRNHQITTGQEIAVKMSKSQPITFIWGPPGTGKTQTLAKIALTHIKEGNRVLMLSYSNVSVDGAVKRVHDISSNKKPGILVRYGYPRDKELMEHSYLTSYNLAIRNHPELMKEREELLIERKKTSRATNRYLQINNRLAAIRRELADEEKKIVRRAKFVATTVSKAVVDKLIYNDLFDVVIFDEASMAYIPQIVFSASLAEKNFICMGDFRQLPPIVQSSQSSILNADIFQYCGITKAVDADVNHKWLCMLNVQYRMHPQISDFVSRWMYKNLLLSSEDMETKRSNVASNVPVKGYAMALADLSGMMSVCTKIGNNSRVNVLSAFIAFSLALEADKRYDVGIITPYHAQSRLLHAMARDTAEKCPKLHPITCATVHQFQGSEKDVIIYDAVDCYRMPYPGMLLTSTGNNYANRLFNVALTRAKGKFVGVANISYMENKNLSKDLMFQRMMTIQKGNLSCVSGEKLLNKFGVDTESCMHFHTKKGFKIFLIDIAAAKREIRIDIPDIPADDYPVKELVDALQNAKGKGIKVYVRAENKNVISKALKVLTIENKFVANPLAIIDKKIIWFGMPKSNAQFKSEGRMIQTLYRPIIRFEGTHTAKSLYGFMEMSRTIDQSTKFSMDDDGQPLTDTFASYVLANKKCPICGRQMKLQKSKKGKFFLACTGYPNCHETDLVDVDLVEDYFYRNGGTGQKCVRCNCSLEAKMGPYGLYIQCCSYQRHKYKLDEI